MEANLLVIPVLPQAQEIPISHAFSKRLKNELTVNVTVRVSGNRIVRNLSSSLVSNPEVIISTSRMYLDISDEI